MTDIPVRGKVLDVDIRTELEEFEWTRPKWSNDKLLAASPFRYDKTPSFMVRLEPYGDLPAGVWTDSGAYESEWASGGFVKLLSFLRNETTEEAEDYLLAKYDFGDDNETIRLPQVRLTVGRNRQALDETMIFSNYRADLSDYLVGRGITGAVQREYGALAGVNNIALPWRSASGKLCNVKYRATSGKMFWYEKGGQPIRELVYGLDVIWRQKERQAVLCEAEIDALSWREAGYAAMAVGGVAFNRIKAERIAGSPVQHVIIATDNDKAGEKLRQEIEAAMRGYVRVSHAKINSQVKDANESLVRFGVNSLREAVSNTAIGKTFNLRLL